MRDAIDIQVQVNCRCGTTFTLEIEELEEGRSCETCGLFVQAKGGGGARSDGSREVFAEPEFEDDGRPPITVRCLCTQVNEVPATAAGRMMACSACKRYILVPAEAPETRDGEDDEESANRAEQNDQGGGDLELEESAPAPATAPTLQPRRSSQRLLRPEVQENARSRAIWLTVAAGSLVLLAGLGLPRLLELREPAPGPVELAPASRDEVSRRLRAWAPLLLDEVRTPAFDEATADLQAVRLVAVERLISSAGVVVERLSFRARDTVGEIGGHCILKPRPLPDTLDPTRRPALVLVDLLVRRTITQRDGVPLEEPLESTVEQIPGTTITCAYDARFGTLSAQSWTPPLDGATGPASVRSTPALDGILVWLEPHLRTELNLSRPGNELLLTSLSPPGEPPELTFRFLGPHPLAAQPEAHRMWQATISAECPDASTAGGEGAVPLPVRITLAESLTEEGASQIATRTTEIPCQLVAESRQLFLPPQAEKDIVRHGLFPAGR